MRPARLERAPQRRAGTEQVRLPDILLERLRAQPVRQRPVGAAGPGHLASRPITSTPAGGVNVNRSGANFALRD